MPSIEFIASETENSAEDVGASSVFSSHSSDISAHGIWQKRYSLIYPEGVEPDHD